MLADLNSLLAAHARQEDTTDQFADFMDKHGDFFPENPENVDELIDALARRQAAAQRMMASLSPGAARAAGPADESGAGRRRPGLGDGAAVGQPARAAARAGPRVAGGHAAGTARRSATARRSRRSPRSPTWRRCRPQLSQNYAGSTLDDVDVELRRAPTRLARRPATCEALRDLERELEQQGYLTARRRRSPADSPGRTSAGPDRTEAGLRPDRGDRTRRPRRPPDRLGGRADRADPAVGVRRRAADRRARVRWRTRCAGLGCADRLDTGAVQLAVEDFEVTETERRTSGGGRAVRRPVVLDGAGRPLGPDEADRPGAQSPDRDPLPAGRAAGDRVQPGRPAADPVRAGRGRAGVDPGHQPAARADAGRPAPAPPSRRRAGGAGGHRRRADRAPDRGRGRRVPLADHDGDAAGHDRRRSTSLPATARRSTRSCSARTPVWPGSSTRWPGAAAAGCSPPTSAGWGSTSSPTTCRPARVGGDAGRSRCRRRRGVGWSGLRPHLDGCWAAGGAGRPRTPDRWPDGQPPDRRPSGGPRGVLPHRVRPGVRCGRRGLAAPRTRQAVDRHVRGGRWRAEGRPLRWAAPGGLRSLVEDLAAGLDVVDATTVREVRRSANGWSVDDRRASAVVLAMPDPQAHRLLDESLREELPAVAGFEPVLALVATWAQRCWGLRRAVRQRPPVAGLGGRRRPTPWRRRTRAGRPLHVLVRRRPPGGPGDRRAGAEQSPAGAPRGTGTVRHPGAPLDVRPAGRRTPEPYALAEGGLGLCGDGWAEKPRVEAAYLSGRTLAEALLAR